MVAEDDEDVFDIDRTPQSRSSSRRRRRQREKSTALAPVDLNTSRESSTYSTSRESTTATSASMMKSIQSHSRSRSYSQSRSHSRSHGHSYNSPSQNSNKKHHHPQNQNNQNNNNYPNDNPNPRYSEHNRSGFSSGLSSSKSRSSRRRNRIYHFDDISSLHCDEYGYDRKHATVACASDDDDSVSEFFQAPSKQELSTELFKLVEAGTSCSDALECLGRLRKWGIIADTDPTTMKYLVEFQAVPTLLYFVRAAITRRRSLKKDLVEKLYALKQNTATKSSSKERSLEFRNHQQAYASASHLNERGLLQALQVIHHYTCFSETANSTNKRKSLKSLVLKKAILAQLVDIDGVDLLVNLLEEQLEELLGPTKNGKSNNNNNMIASESQYGHSISKSIWLILMNVGACDHAIQLLKEPKGPRKHSRARRLVYGMVMGLDHRFKVASENDRRILHIMPQWALSSGIDCYNRNNDFFQDCNHNNHNNHQTSSSWMEDLFVALCRLVASKDAEDLDYKPNGTKATTTILPPNDHDEIRVLMIELCMVQKCLTALLDEPNTVLGQDPFVTTLAMSFFYACIRFGGYRYKLLKEMEHQSSKQLHSHRGERFSHSTSAAAAEQMLETSLDYDRLVEFTLASVKSFPSHHLIQGTGCLLLEAIPKSSSYSKTHLDCLGLVGATKNHALDKHWMARTTTCVGDMAEEPCQWYFSTD